MNWQGFKIEAAVHGGFLVTACARPGDFTPFLFAGSIDECLAFIKGQFEEHPPVFPKDSGRVI